MALIRFMAILFLIVGFIMVMGWDALWGGETESAVAWVIFAIGTIGSFICHAADYVVREIRHDIQKLES